MRFVRLSAFGILFVLIAGLRSANASTFSYSFTGITCAPNNTCPGPVISGNIVLTGNLIAPGEYLITGVTGTTMGLAITGIVAPGGYPPVGPNDNDLFPNTGAYFDFNGLSYMLAGGTDFNLYNFSTNSIGGLNFAFGAAGGGLITSFASTVTPEPGSLILVATGALGAFGAVRRRRVRSV